VTEIPNMF